MVLEKKIKKMKMLTSNNLLSDLFRSDFDTVFNDSVLSSYFGNRNPLLNISDNEKEISVEMVIPGFKKNELEISLDNNLLTVKGKKSSDKEEKKTKYLRREFNAQEFVRTFRVDQNVDQESISSTLEDGILTILIPRAKKVESKKVISIC